MGEELKIMIVGDGVSGGVGGAGGAGKVAGGGDGTLKAISNFLSGGLGAVIGGAIGASLGGPAGAALGASIGKAVVGLMVQWAVPFLVGALVQVLTVWMGPLVSGMLAIHSFLISAGLIWAIKKGMDNSEMYSLVKKSVAGGLGAVVDSIIGVGYMLHLWLRDKLPKGVVEFLDDPIPFLEDKITEGWDLWKNTWAMTWREFFTDDDDLGIYFLKSLGKPLTFKSIWDDDQFKFGLDLDKWVFVARATMFKFKDLWDENQTPYGMDILSLVMFPDKFKIKDLIDTDTKMRLPLDSIEVPKIRIEFDIDDLKTKAKGLLGDIIDEIDDALDLLGIDTSTG